MTAPPVCVLLGSHNGEAYLEEQLCSIQSQTFSDWILLASDDSSTDGSAGILEKFAAGDARIRVHETRHDGATGAAANFGRLISAGLATGSTVFFFADQDDTWQPDKVEQQLAAFPSGGGEPEPLLLHSDLAVVSEHLDPINPSLISYMALDPEPRDPLTYLLTRNFVTGCAMAANRALLEQATPIPAAAIMHDWWLALVAACYGSIRFQNTALVNYRQHASNAIGAKGFWHGLNPGNNWVQGWRAGNREFMATLLQADALLVHARDRGGYHPRTLELLERYTSIPAKPRLARVIEARRLKLRQGNALLSLILYIRLLGLGRMATDDFRQPVS